MADKKETPFTSADFHSAVQKQLLNAVQETLASSKLEWRLVAPFLDTAHEICRADVREGAHIRLHTLRADGDAWVEAEEAFLGISVADREDGHEWLSETWWLSDIAIADGDPDKARTIAAALEKSVAKIRAWADEKTGGPA